MMNEANEPRFKSSTTTCEGSTYYINMTMHCAGSCWSPHRMNSRCCSCHLLLLVSLSDAYLIMSVLDYGNRLRKSSLSRLSAIDLNIGRVRRRSMAGDEASRLFVFERKTFLASTACYPNTPRHFQKVTQSKPLFRLLRHVEQAGSRADAEPMGRRDRKHRKILTVTVRK